MTYVATTFTPDVDVTGRPAIAAVSPARLEIVSIPVARWRLAIKRTFDVAVAVVALALALPVIALAALAIRAHDGGDVFFRQRRVGRNGAAFTIYKLRTMVPDAEAMLPSLLDRNERQGPLFKLAGDPRVTPVGRVLRATSLDELPQLFNVIRGDMSLVGPRPALPREVEQFGSQLLARHEVLPGITGLWQLHGRDDPDFSVYERLDIEYVNRWSLKMDAMIVLRTVSTVVARSAASFRSVSTPGHRHILD